MKKPGKTVKVGFIGNGYVGKHIADDFERRGHAVVRYALEAPFNKNKESVGACDIIFVAVPTPTTPQGFDISIIEEVLAGLSKKIVVIKSTILPGTTKKLQKKFRSLTLLFCPEFLGESTAAYDAAHPIMNIIGIPTDSVAHRRAAKKVMSILPRAPFMQVCSSTEAEIQKYAHNTSGYVQIVVFNLFYDLARALKADWKPIQQALVANPYIASRYSYPVHKGGRGAGGNCFVKDFAAFRQFFGDVFPRNSKALGMLRTIEAQNLHLLVSTKKDVGIVRRVYGKHGLKQ
jgi:UDPglucose 6-dehydrogenase